MRISLPFLLIDLVILIALSTNGHSSPAYQSPHGFSLIPPDGWTAANPQSGCPSNGFCFVINPQGSEVMFVKPVQAKGDAVHAVNLLSVMRLPKPATEKDLGSIKNQMIEGLKKTGEIAVMKKFEVLESKATTLGAHPAVLLTTRFDVSHYKLELLQAFVSRAQSTFILSCTLDRKAKNVEELKKQCLQSFGSLPEGRHHPRLL